MSSHGRPSRPARRPRCPHRRPRPPRPQPRPCPAPRRRPRRSRCHVHRRQPRFRPFPDATAIAGFDHEHHDHQQGRIGAVRYDGSTGTVSLLSATAHEGFTIHPTQVRTRSKSISKATTQSRGCSPGGMANRTSASRKPTDGPLRDAHGTQQHEYTPTRSSRRIGDISEVIDFIGSLGTCSRGHPGPAGEGVPEGPDRPSRVPIEGGSPRWPSGSRLSAGNAYGRRCQMSPHGAVVKR